MACKAGQEWNGKAGIGEAGQGRQGWDWRDGVGRETTRRGMAWRGRYGKLVNHREERE